MTYPWLQAARQQFSQQLASERQAHAILLAGPAGLGKAELANEMAAALLCLEPPSLKGKLEESSMACGSCRSCQLFSTGAHPDFRLMSFISKENSEELRTVIIVDQVRQLIGNLQLTNSLSPRKVAIIHPAEAMNRSAANAILKTLEEPAGEAVLILVCNDASSLPATIRSRCQVLTVRAPAIPEALDWLQKQAGADEHTARLALQASAASPLRAAMLLKTGRTDDYRMMLENLDRVSRDSNTVGMVFEQLSKLDPAELWNWLALASAEQIRVLLGVGEAGLGSSRALAAGKKATQRFSDLHRQANRNRRLLSTPVRKDLLLRDWLIQWSATTGS